METLTTPGPVTFRLFVYGTFLSGEREHDVIAKAKCHGVVKTARGYSLVEARAMAGLLEGGDSEVTGELWEVGYDVLNACDKRRDHPALYIRRDVRLADGSVAHAYFLRHEQARGLRRIRSGDWRQRFAVAKPASGAWGRWAKSGR
ncbi:MAG: gamma-glutamylcyclotransferase [Sorangiineae bacterium PRO1]|nr:gamma-glutamylcyclotransferase [Sorangiineae bacterium PRO1]